MGNSLPILGNHGGHHLSGMVETWNGVIWGCTSRWGYIIRPLCPHVPASSIRRRLSSQSIRGTQEISSVGNMAKSICSYVNKHD
uniref:Uncharacterized protein n=1 Tax=Picea sitchensis TaxID=3332 RepID=A0A6B9XTJ8_PICSI|nr:hypothetical protein Q903MT_gene5412 [Picea sitchensis]